MNIDPRLIAKLKAERSKGQSPSVWVPKKFGIVDFKPFNVAAYFKRLIKANLDALRSTGDAEIPNAAEGWHYDGLLNMFATDAPYLVRYLLVQFAPANATQPSGIPYTLPSSALFQQYPIANGQVPLGICEDEPAAGTAGTLDLNPIPSRVAALGSVRKTLIGITDSVVVHGGTNFLVPSTTTPGYLKSSAGLAAGAYFSVGYPLSDSEGAGAQIEFDPRPGTFLVDVLT
jgi:hypothetical protein